MSVKSLLLIGFLCLLASAFMMSCDNCNEQDSLEVDPPLVVEGWIEDGEPPVVFVTHAMNLSAPSPTLEGVVEKWSRVTVKDLTTGESEILTGRINNDYSVRFQFITSKLRGKEGHAYKLEVETDRHKVVSTSKINSIASIVSLKAELYESNDSLFSIRAYLSDVDPNAYYKLFVKSQSDKRYYSAFLGTFSGASYDAETGIVVTKGFHTALSWNDNENEEKFTHYFKKGERIIVKLCSMERDVYEFWKVYESNITFSNNMFITFTENCPSTVDGAFGYWAAYGSTVASIVVR